MNYIKDKRKLGARFLALTLLKTKKAGAKLLKNRVKFSRAHKPLNPRSVTVADTDSELNCEIKPTLHQYGTMAKFPIHHAIIHCGHLLKCPKESF